MTFISKKLRTHLVHTEQPLTGGKLLDRVAVCGVPIKRAETVAIFDDFPVGPGAKIIDEKSGLICQDCLAAEIPSGHIYGMKPAGECSE